MNIWEYEELTRIMNETEIHPLKFTLRVVTVCIKNGLLPSLSANLLTYAKKALSIAEDLKKGDKDE